MARMRFNRITSPEDNQITTVLGLAQGTGTLTNLLNRHDRRRMTLRGGRVDRGANRIGKPNGRSLPIGTAARQAINQRAGGLGEQLCCVRDGLRSLHWAALNHRYWRPISTLLNVPTLSQFTGTLGFNNPIIRSLYAINCLTVGWSKYLNPNPDFAVNIKYQLKYMNIQ